MIAGISDKQLPGSRIDRDTLHERQRRRGRRRDLDLCREACLSQDAVGRCVDAGPAMEAGRYCQQNEQDQGTFHEGGFELVVRTPLRCDPEVLALQVPMPPSPIQTDAILSASDLSLSFGRHPILDGATLALYAG